MTVLVLPRAVSGRGFTRFVLTASGFPADRARASIAAGSTRSAMAAGSSCFLPGVEIQ